MGTVQSDFTDAQRSRRETELQIEKGISLGEPAVANLKFQEASQSNKEFAFSSSAAHCYFYTKSLLQSAINSTLGSVLPTGEQLG